jgi:hypothetical protein
MNLDLGTPLLSALPIAPSLIVPQLVFWGLKAAATVFTVGVATGVGIGAEAHKKFPEAVEGATETGKNIVIGVFHFVDDMIGAASGRGPRAGSRTGREKRPQ